MHVKVWNDNTFDHKEDFKGASLVIPAGGFIEMEYEEAIDFKGQFTPPAPRDCVGDPARFYKMIRVENPPPGSIYKDEVNVNHATGQKAASAAELLAGLAAFAQANPHLVVKDPEADKAAAGRDDELARLKAENAALKAAAEGKKGPGRPRKAAG